MKLTVTSRCSELYLIRRVISPVAILVVTYFLGFQAATLLFRLLKPMFIHIALLVCHRKVRVVFVEFHTDIARFIYEPVPTH